MCVFFFIFCIALLLEKKATTCLHRNRKSMLQMRTKFKELVFLIMNMPFYWVYEQADVEKNHACYELWDYNFFDKDHEIIRPIHLIYVFLFKRIRNLPVKCRSSKADFYPETVIPKVIAAVHIFGYLVLFLYKSLQKKRQFPLTDMISCCIGSKNLVVGLQKMLVSNQGLRKSQEILD